jgi:hypothetical protein
MTLVAWYNIDNPRGSGMNQKILVTIKKENVQIERDVFLMLLDKPMVSHLVSFKNTLTENKIAYVKLKDLSRRCSVPLPLLFSTVVIAKKQTIDDEIEVNNKFHYKPHVSVSSRGSFLKGDVDLIIKNIAIKQTLLNERLLPGSNNCEYIGLISALKSKNISESNIIEKIRNYFDFDLHEFRALPMKKALDYVVDKIESKNIFVSFSSHEYMPQKIRKDITMSGFCIKDNKYPFVFINTRDGDDMPIILETDARQLFTLISMVISIGMNKFFLEFNTGRRKPANLKIIHKMTGEFLLPKEDLFGKNVDNLEQLDLLSKKFKLSKSMIIFRLSELNIITGEKAGELREQLKNIKTSFFPKRPKPVSGFGKYNGKRLSKEFVTALSSKKITKNEFNLVLFRKNHVNNSLHEEYRNTYK